MAEKSSRRLMLEASLSEDPHDPFLRYGLAVQCLREGDIEEGRQRLHSLINDDPEGQVAAYQQLGQSYAEMGEVPAALTILRTGVAKARSAGNWHAAEEMEQLIASVDGNESAT
jgi:predicted Zn-dependent protease